MREVQSGCGLQCAGSGLAARRAGGALGVDEEAHEVILLLQQHLQGGSASAGGVRV